MAVAAWVKNAAPIVISELRQVSGSGKLAGSFKHFFNRMVEVLRDY